MNQPLLTVAIPTLNRLEFLKGTIDAFLDQLAPYQGEIEFIVLNNSSDDGTDKWLESNYEGHSILKYYNFPERVDIVGSISRCIEKGKGEYIWVFGDDDLPMPFAISTIYKLIQSSSDRNYSILYFNSIRSSLSMESYTTVYQNTITLGPKEYSIADFVNTFNLNLGLIITLIFKRDNWMEGKFFYKDNYYGYGFLAPLIAGSQNSSCLYYPFPITVHRIGGQRYVNKWPLYILIGVPSMFQDLQDCGLAHKNLLKTWLETYSILDFVKVLIVAKAFNYSAKNQLWKQAVKYQSGLKKLLIPVFRYGFPSWLAKMIFDVGASIKGASE